MHDILATTDIVQVIGDRVPIKKTGRDYSACCPLHSEKTPSFTVSPTKQFFYCFGCGASGDAIAFLRQYEGLSFVEAVRALGGDVKARPQSSAAVAARQAEKVRRERWRWFAGVVFESILDVEVGGWPWQVERDLYLLREKCQQRGRGADLPLSVRERGMVMFMCSSPRVDREVVRVMYGI